jgi:peptide/nickel transport system substrate-binding protein
MTAMLLSQHLPASGSSLRRLHSRSRCSAALAVAGAGTGTRALAALLLAAMTVLMLFAWSSPAAGAAALRLALSGDVTSLDPHFLNAAPNNTVARHVFESLVQVDADGQLQPALAESWRAVDPTTWEFRLRRGVRFHNGQEMTAEDVVFSLERPSLLVKSPGPFTAFTRPVVGKEIVDPYTIRLRTATPYGPLPLDLSNVFIVSRKIAESASTDDFNTGKAVIGTGPWRFSNWRRGDAVELLRNASLAKQVRKTSVI